MRLNLLIILCLSFVTTAISQNNFAGSGSVAVNESDGEGFRYFIYLNVTFLSI